MKSILVKCFPTTLLLIVTLVFFTGTTIAQNTLSGIIFDNNRKPVSEINIELLDNFERLIARLKTRASGFYRFNNLPAGIYYVRVLPGNTNFKEFKERIDIGALNTLGGIDNKQVDIFLQPYKNKERNSGPASVIFVQEVPENAKKLYDEASKEINKKNNQLAIKKIKEALVVFPDYFSALESLGILQNRNKEYAEAEINLLKANTINPKSFRSLFELAVAQNNLNKKAEAIKSLNQANVLNSKSVNSNLLLGILQRDMKMFDEAKKSLIIANILSKNNNPDVHWNLALLYYYNLNLYEDAAKELELYVKSIPKKERKRMKNKITQVKKLIKTFRNKAKKSS